MRRERRQLLFERVERVTEIPMFVLSIVFLLVVLFLEMRSLSHELYLLLDSFLWIIWSVFAVELAIKTYLAPDRRRYIISNWPDVLTVIVPFLRPLRLLRIMVSAARAWKHIKNMLKRQTLSFIGLSSLITVVLSAALVYAAEQGTDGPIQEFPDAIWWALTTITTVGYGDVYPTTPMGRGVATFLMLTGITLFGLLTAKVAAFFVEEDVSPPPAQAEKLDEVLERLRRIEQQIARLERQE